MADPTVQSFCCRRPPQLHLLTATDTLMNSFSSKPYLITSLVCASLGMTGAVYQILRYLLFRDNFRLYYLQTMRHFRVPRRLLAQSVGQKIVVFLAAADFCASSGVFIRATLWMYIRPNMTVQFESERIISCAVISGLIQYFYTCTWLWTLCYAINIRAYLKDEVIPEKKFHAFVWPTAACLTGIGTTVLYYPNADCHNFTDLFQALTRVLPNYCATYLPIILVMLINPLIYANAARDLDIDLASGGSQFTTSTERNVNHTLKWKFFMINVVFFICWLPNLVCGVTLWTSWHKLPERVLVPVFYVMAIVNPLQAFFNALVYRRWQPASVSSGGARLNQSAYSRVLRGADVACERSPLLQHPGSPKPSAPPFHEI